MYLYLIPEHQFKPPHLPPEKPIDAKGSEEEEQEEEEEE